MSTPGGKSLSPFVNAVGIDRVKRCRCGLKMHYGKLRDGGRWHACAHCDKPDCGCVEHRR